MAREWQEDSTTNVINPVANEDVRKLRAFSLNQPQFPYWGPPLPVTFRSHSGRDDVTSGWSANVLERYDVIPDGP